MATIKAGTYKFNDVLTLDTGFNEYLDFTIPSLKVGENGNVTTNTDPQNHSNIGSIENDGVFFLYYTGNPIYSADTSYLWNFTCEIALSQGLIPDDSVKGYGQIITVTEDAEVDDTFATWFNANTEPVKKVIKAGTYRWNDVVTEAPFVNGMSFGFDLDFTIKGAFVDNPNSPYKDFDHNGTSTFNRISMHTDGNIHYGRDDNSGDYYYETEAGWNRQWAMYVMLTQKFINELKGLGQIITVTKDTETSDEAYEWFTSNTKVLVGYVSYDNTNIANLLVGQTVTIKCKGKVMKDDIVITL